MRILLRPLKNAQFRFARHRQYESIESGREKGSPRAATGWQMTSARELTVPVHRDRIEETFTATYVNAGPLGIKKQVVGVPSDLAIANDPAIRRVHLNDPGRVTAADEDSTVLLVQSHRKVRSPFVQRPGGNDSSRFSIHDGDLPGVRDVDENT
jgi:hypothetical protein